MIRDNISNGARKRIEKRNLRLSIRDFLTWIINLKTPSSFTLKDREEFERIQTKAKKVRDGSRWA